MGVVNVSFYMWLQSSVDTSTLCELISHFKINGMTLERDRLLFSWLVGIFSKFEQEKIFCDLMIYSFITWAIICL